MAEHRRFDPGVRIRDPHGATATVLSCYRVYPDASRPEYELLVELDQPRTEWVDGVYPVSTTRARWPSSLAVEDNRGAIL